MNILSFSVSFSFSKTVICDAFRFFALLTWKIFFPHDEKITPMGGAEKEGDGRDRLRRIRRPFDVQIVYRFLATIYELFFSYELRATSYK